MHFGRLVGEELFQARSGCWDLRSVLELHDDRGRTRRVAAVDQPLGLRQMQPDKHVVELLHELILRLDDC